MSDSGENTTHITDQENTLDVNLAIKFLFLSFRHSQGNPGLQRQIFNYASSKRKWELTPEIKRDVEKQAPKIFKAYISTKTHKGQFRKESDLDIEINSELTQWRLTQFNVLDPDMDEMAQAIIKQDQGFFARGRGREHEEPLETNPHSDNYQSYFCYYGLEQHPTGLKVLDELYGDVVQEVKDKLDNEPAKEFVESLIQIISTYYKKHEEKQIPKAASELLNKALEIVTQRSTDSLN